MKPANYSWLKRLLCAVLITVPGMAICSKQHLLRIEKIQHRTLKFVFNDFSMSYSLALSRSNMQHLYVQRQRYMLIEVFKIYHKQGPLYLYDLFESPINARRYGRNDRRL